MKKVVFTDWHQWQRASDYEKLDSILDFFNTGTNIKQGFRVITIAQKLVEPTTKYQDYLPEIELALNHLAKVEELIDVDSDRTYKINFSGRMFINKGGYLERERILRQKQDFSEEMARRGVESSENLTQLTRKAKNAGWAAAFGTAFLGLIELIKLIPLHHHHCP
jgi:hypothetical protein